MKPKKKEALPEDTRLVSLSLKVKLIVQFEAAEDVGFMMDWFQGDKMRSIDLGELKDLELFTGDLPASQPMDQAGAKDAKKTADSKKQKKQEQLFEPGKQYSGFFEFAEEEVRIDEAWCVGVCSRPVAVLITNLDEMNVSQVIKVDLSRLLLHEQTDPSRFEVCFEESIMPAKPISFIKGLSLRVECNKSFLKPDFKHFLNPMTVDIGHIEDLYVDSKRSARIEPLMVRYDLFGDGSFVESHRVPSAANVRVDATHVFLMGLRRQVDLKEHFERHRVRVEVHDRDEVKTDTVRKSLQYIELKEPEVENEELDPKKKKKPGVAVVAGAKKPAETKKKDEPKKEQKKKREKKKDYTFDDFIMPKEPEYYNREFGEAQFFLKELLNPYALDLHLQAPVCPREVFVDEDRKNLSLNQTARKRGRDISKATDYFGSNTLLSMDVHLAFPLDSYREAVVKPEEAKDDLKKSSAAELKKSAADKKTGKPGAQIQKEEEEKQAVPELTETQLLRQSQRLKPVTPKPVFERAVYIFEFKNRDFLRLLQRALVEVNAEGMNITGGEREVRTRKLTLEERKSKTLDFVGGVEVIDKHFRMFLLEGLGDSGMQRLEAIITKTSANTASFKIMKNPRLTFDERMYAEFDLDVKKVKLRTSLKSLLAQPKLYSRKTVPQEVYDTLVRLHRLREKNTIAEVLDSDLWPAASAVVELERNYGDALNDDDLYGIQPKRKLRKRGTRGSVQKASSDFASEATSVISMEEVRESQLREQASQYNKSLADGSGLDATMLGKSSGSMEARSARSIDKPLQATAATAASLPKLRPAPQTREFRQDPDRGATNIERSDNDSMLVDDLPRVNRTFRGGSKRRSMGSTHLRSRLQRRAVRLVPHAAAAAGTRCTEATRACPPKPSQDRNTVYQAA